MRVNGTSTVKVRAETSGCPAARLVGNDLPYRQQFLERFLLVRRDGNEEAVGFDGDTSIGETDFAMARHATLTAFVDAANHGQRLADRNSFQKAQLQLGRHHPLFLSGDERSASQCLVEHGGGNALVEYAG